LRATITRRIRETRKRNYKAEGSDSAGEDNVKGKDISNINHRRDKNKDKEEESDNSGLVIQAKKENFRLHILNVFSLKLYVHVPHDRLQNNKICVLCLFIYYPFVIYVTVFESMSDL